MVILYIQVEITTPNKKITSRMEKYITSKPTEEVKYSAAGNIFNMICDVSKVEDSKIFSVITDDGNIMVIPSDVIRDSVFDFSMYKKSNGKFVQLTPKQIDKFIEE